MACEECRTAVPAGQFANGYRLHIRVPENPYAPGFFATLP